MGKHATFFENLRTLALLMYFDSDILKCSYFESFPAPFDLLMCPRFAFIMTNVATLLAEQVPRGYVVVVILLIT